MGLHAEVLACMTCVSVLMKVYSGSMALHVCECVCLGSMSIYVSKGIMGVHVSMYVGGT